MRCDDQVWRVDQQGVAVGRGVRNSFGSYDRACAHAIFDDYPNRLRPPDMICQQARQDIGAASRCERNDDLDCSRWLGLCILAEQSEEDDGGSDCGPLRELTARKFHRFPPVTTKLHHACHRAEGPAMPPFGESCRHR